MKEIILSTGHKTHVDDNLYDYLNQWKWTLTNGYVQRCTKDHGQMNRIICTYLGLKIAGLVVDHKDRNKLNNCGYNLEPKTQSKNLHNATIGKKNSSGVRGISFESGKWRVRITIEKRIIRLGSYTTLEEATKIKRNAEKNLGLLHQEVEV